MTLKQKIDIVVHDMGQDLLIYKADSNEGVLSLALEIYARMPKYLEIFQKTLKHLIPSLRNK